MTSAGPRRTDIASRIVHAPARRIFHALLDPDALASWLPPEGMSAELPIFEAREGGRYRMILKYDDPAAAGKGKATEDADVVNGTFAEIVQDVRVVQLVDFESDDEAFAGTMKMTWSLEPAAQGTRVTITAEQVPPGITAEDHKAGLESSLANLAVYVSE